MGRKELKMEESVTYQAILTKGRMEEARKWLLRWGRERLGLAPTRIKTAIEAINDLDQLDQLGHRLKEATSWDDLLGVQSSGPRRRK